MSGQRPPAINGRRVLAVLTALVVLASAAVSQLVIEDRVKRVAFTLPDGFVYDSESTSDVLVLLGPKLSGGQARLELHRLGGELPCNVALLDFMEPLFGDADARPWELGEAAARMDAAFVADHKRERKLLRTAVAAGRHGPSVVVLVASAPPGLFDQLADDWRGVFDSLQLLPFEPLFHDEAMGVAVHVMPDLMEPDAEGTEAGSKATWAWTSVDKSLTATIVIEAGPRVADLERWAREREQSLSGLAEVTSVKRSARPVAGQPGVQFELVLGGGTTRTIRAVQNDGHLIQISCTAPTRMLENTFQSVFESAVAGLSLDDG